MHAALRWVADEPRLLAGARCATGSLRTRLKMTGVSITWGTHGHFRTSKVCRQLAAIDVRRRTLPVDAAPARGRAAAAQPAAAIGAARLVHTIRLATTGSVVENAAAPNAHVSRRTRTAATAAVVGLTWYAAAIGALGGWRARSTTPATAIWTALREDAIGHTPSQDTSTVVAKSVGRTGTARTSASIGATGHACTFFAVLRAVSGNVWE